VIQNPSTNRELLGICLVLAAVSIIAALLFTGRANASEPSRTFEVLQSFARHHTDQDEPEADRDARLTSHSEAIDSATSNRLERAVLVTLAGREGVNLARFVDLDLDTCRKGIDGWCDRGAAFSIYQLHGTDRTGDRAWAARKAIGLWRYHGKRCASMGFDYTVGAFAGYGSGGRTCDTADARDRAAEARRRAGAL
jgi:hypothetical protein